MTTRPPETEPCAYGLEPCPIIEAEAQSGAEKAPVWTCQRCHNLWERSE